MSRNNTNEISILTGNGQVVKITDSEPPLAHALALSYCLTKHCLAIDHIEILSKHGIEVPASIYKDLEAAKAEYLELTGMELF